MGIRSDIFVKCFSNIFLNDFICYRSKNKVVPFPYNYKNKCLGNMTCCCGCCMRNKFHRDIKKDIMMCNTLQQNQIDFIETLNNEDKMDIILLYNTIITLYEDRYCSHIDNLK